MKQYYHGSLDYFKDVTLDYSYGKIFWLTDRKEIALEYIFDKASKIVKAGYLYTFSLKSSANILDFYNEDGPLIKKIVSFLNKKVNSYFDINNYQDLLEYGDVENHIEVVKFLISLGIDVFIIQDSTERHRFLSYGVLDIDQISMKKIEKIML